MPRQVASSCWNLRMVQDFVQLKRKQMVDLGDALIDHRLDVRRHRHLAFQHLADELGNQVLAALACAPSSLPKRPSSTIWSRRLAPSARSCAAAAAFAAAACRFAIVSPHLPCLAFASSSLELAPSVSVFPRALVQQTAPAFSLPCRLPTQVRQLGAQIQQFVQRLSPAWLLCPARNPPWS